MPDTGPSRILVLALVLFVIAAGIGAALVASYLLHPKPVAGILTIQEGDNATVNYIGMLGSGPQQGKVFDTSLFSVYQNNATWPKALTYQPHPKWSVLPVHIGPTGSYSIGSLNFSTVVTGFWQGLIGAPGNQSRWITIPWQLGYGPRNPACFLTTSLAFTLPVFTIVTPAAFSKVYPNANATAGTSFTDPTYAWTDLVLNVNASAITVESLPTIGHTAAPYGFNITVTNVSTKVISLTNDITPTNYGNILGKTSASGICGASQFIVTAVNPGAGTFTEYWASNYLQQESTTMVFIVTPVDILPP